MTSPWFVKIYQKFCVLLTIPRDISILLGNFREFHESSVFCQAPLQTSKSCYLLPKFSSRQPFIGLVNCDAR